MCCLLPLLCVSLVGCYSTSPGRHVPALGPGCAVQQGQAVWIPRRGGTEWVGDLVLATAPDGRTSVQFVKPPMTLVVAQHDAQGWRIEFPMKHIVISRAKGRPPARFVWLHLAVALRGASLPDGLCFNRQADGNWRLENTKTGESVQGFLSP